MHIASRWQIALATDPTFAAPVYELFTTEASELTEVPFIDGLTPSTNYLARVAYYDENITTVGFSASFPFTTLAADLIDPPGSFVQADQGCSDC